MLQAATPDSVSPDPKDPQYQSKGDQKRTYIFPETGESIPYHIYVPTKWNKNTKLPLVIVLHGANQGADTVFERNDGILGKTAEQHGYIVAAPIGYREAGGYNNQFRIVPAARPAGAAAPKGPDNNKKGKGGPATPLTAQDRERSEQDVLNVADLVAKEYNADPNRRYLMGNSMGGGGTWYLGQKYPERWTAIAPSAGPVSPDEFPYARLKNVPVLVLHGVQDQVTSFDASKTMFEKAKAAGVNAEFLPIQEGDHFLAWTTVVPQIFDFFDKHKKK
jgi:predicted peptidase